MKWAWRSAKSGHAWTPRSSESLEPSRLPVDEIAAGIRAWSVERVRVEGYGPCSPATRCAAPCGGAQSTDRPMPQQTQPYDQNIYASLEARIGSHGLDRAAFEAALRDTAPALDRLPAAHGAGRLPLLQQIGRAHV